MTKGLALAVALAASSCGIVDDWRYHGTQLGLERCIEGVATKFVGEAQAKGYCIQQQEVELDGSKVTGRGQFRSFGNAVYFYGQITNDASDMIITSFSVSARTKGTQYGGTKGFNGLILHTFETYQFSLGSDELGPTPPKSADEVVDWNIMSVRGIRLVQP